MEVTSLCLMLCLIPAAARLDISPKSAQFFQYTEISLRCVEESRGWTVTRNTSHQTSETCNFGWGTLGESSCTIEHALPSDTGVYWCQSPQNEVSNTVTITVKGSGLILEVPALPVMEGDNVTLGCSYREKGKEGSSSGFTAAFYQDHVFKGNQLKGVKTLSPVTKDHEGFHKCGHPTFGESPESFLTVTAVQVQSIPTSPPPDPDPDPDPPVMTLPKLLCSVMLFVLYTVILIICIHMYRKWARAQAESRRRKTSGRHQID